MPSQASNDKDQERGSGNTKIKGLLVERAQLHVEAEKADVEAQEARVKLAQNLVKLRRAGYLGGPQVQCW